MELCFFWIAHLAEGRRAFLGIKLRAQSSIAGADGFNKLEKNRTLKTITENQTLLSFHLAKPHQVKSKEETYLRSIHVDLGVGNFSLDEPVRSKRKFVSVTDNEGSHSCQKSSECTYSARMMPMEYTSADFSFENLRMLVGWVFGRGKHSGAV
jgi:hypothetical protein